MISRHRVEIDHLRRLLPATLRVGVALFLVALGVANVAQAGRGGNPWAERLLRKLCGWGLSS